MQIYCEFDLSAVTVLLTTGLGVYIAGSNNMPKLILCFQINLIAPPLYVVTTTTLDRDGALESLARVIAAVKESIEKSTGNFLVKMEVITKHICCF